MKGVVRRRRGALQDLVDIFRYHAREAGLGTARRFLAEAEATFGRLAGRPGIGARYELDHPALADLRFSPVSRFKKYLVFYRPIPGGIEILRVLHGARDIPALLADDLGAAGGETMTRPRGRGANEPGRPRGTLPCLNGDGAVAASPHLRG